MKYRFDEACQPPKMPGLCSSCEHFFDEFVSVVRGSFEPDAPPLLCIECDLNADDATYLLTPKARAAGS